MTDRQGVLDLPTEAEAIAEAEFAVAPSDVPEPPEPLWRERLRPVAAISAGAVVGGCARYAVGLWAAASWGAGFPWGTLAVNLAGSFVIGFYLTLVTERFVGSSTTRLFLATGVLGALTTFSTFSYDIVHLTQQGQPLTAAAYAAASLVGGLAAVLLGIVAAHAL